MEQCIAQIVLHKSGIDPDFHYTKKFNVDVDNIIGECMCGVLLLEWCALIENLAHPEGMVDKAKVEEAEARAFDLEQLVS